MKKVLLFLLLVSFFSCDMSGQLETEAVAAGEQDLSHLYDKEFLTEEEGQMLLAQSNTRLAGFSDTIMLKNPGKRYIIR